MGEQQTLFQLPFDASFRLNELKTVRFLASGESLVEADVKKHTCSCGQDKCGHLHILTDLVTNGGKSFRYTAKSAMHKEIRRGDLNAAVRWSRWVRACCGESDLKRYLRNIILEESRNIELLTGSGKASSDRLVRLLTGSAKKWDLPCRSGVFARYVAAYKRARGLSKAPDMSEAGHDLDWWLTTFWFVRMTENSGVAATFENLLTFEAKARGNWALRLMNHAKRREHSILDAGFYEAKVLVEMFCGKWDESANVAVARECVADKDEVPTIPVCEPYVDDNHTAVGARRIAGCLALISPKRPMPDKVDLRWSGLLRGVLWREWAAREFPGNYLDVGWVMPVSAEIWENVCEADGFFYEKLYKRAGL
jgi:hypothetical protein